MRVTHSKEVEDSHILASIIRDDQWMNEDTIIVCCSPDYSSLTTQVINHYLSVDNDHELYEQLFLEMPYPTMNQIWNRESREYEKFDRYIVDWVNSLSLKHSYLFIDSATLRGKNFQQVCRTMNTRKIEKRFASVYMEENAIFKPDYVAEVFSSAKEGGLSFEWENPLNKNWDY